MKPTVRSGRNSPACGMRPTSTRWENASIHPVAITAAEHRNTRIAQADASWEFAVVDSDTSFSMQAFRESRATFSWALHDLTLDTINAYASSEVGGWSQTGALLLGHTYRLTESARTSGTSDELAQLNFSVGTDVVFIPELSTMALAALGVGVLALRRTGRG